MIQTDAIDKAISRLLSKQLDDLWAAINSSNEASQRAYSIAVEAKNTAEAAAASAASILQIRDELEELKSQMDELRGRLASQAASMTAIGSRISDLEERIKANRGDIDANREGIGALAKYFTTLDSAVSALNSRVKSLSTDIDVVANELGRVRGRIKNWVDRGIEQVLDGMGNVVKSIRELVTSIGSRRDFDTTYNSREVTEVKSIKVSEFEEARVPTGPVERRVVPATPGAGETTAPGPMPGGTVIVTGSPVSTYHMSPEKEE